MAEKNLSNLHEQLGQKALVRDGLKDAYDAIIAEAQEKGHELADIDGDPQGMGLRVNKNVGGFMPQHQALASARVVGYNAELDALATAYIPAVAATRAIVAKINALGG